MNAVIAELRAMRLGKAADLLEEHGHETLTYYGYPDRRALVRQWSEDIGERLKLRTNNPLERIMREIRRRTRAVGVRHGARTDGALVPHSPMVSPA